MDQDHRMTKKELKALRRMEKMDNAGRGASQNAVKWIIIAVGSAIFLALFAFIIILIKQSKNKPIVLSSSGHIRGAAAASATLAEFGDFQCPACKKSEPFVRKALHDFDGKLKLHFKHFPLTSIHPNAMLAALAAEASGLQDKFFEYHDKLYDDQDTWAGLGAADARKKMVEYAEGLKLNVASFGKDIDSPQMKEAVLKEQNEGIDIGVAATPTFFINNKKVESNPSNYADFKALIEKAIK